ncbi:MAG: adenylate/guanylate cyclase domain-containing protein, partial [Myxococcota bacterium]|nr:adenylate/guanylate cyclase domain-containing protein [Myxococcota bacterium]
YGVIGDTVNVASRLEAYNKELGTTILISDSVYSELEDTLNEKAQDYGQVNLKGRGAAQQVYSLKT